MKKTVLITGASRGIGRATALAFAREGYNVAANYNHSEEEAETLKDEIEQLGCDCIAVKADMRDTDEIRKMVNRTIAHFGKIDALVLNAGIAQQKLFLDITENDWSEMFDINVTGMFRTCKAVLPDMISRQEGCIITVSSIWGECGASCEVHYSAAKAAVIGMTKALAKEMGLSGIRVNCVAPGVIATDMNRMLSADTLEQLREETPLGRIGACSDIAESILFLASDKAAFMTGQILSVNGGFLV